VRTCVGAACAEGTEGGVGADAPVDLMNAQQWNDINVVAGAIKQYFRELVEPVFPYDLYETLMTAVRTCIMKRGNSHPHPHMQAKRLTR
jgi:hypothetical protein